MFNSKHLMFIIAGLTIVSVKTYPAVFTRLAGRDTWLAVAVAMLLILVYISYLIWVCRKKNCYSMAHIYRYTLGPVLGNAMLSLFMLSVLLHLLESAAVESSAMHEQFLLNIPPTAFMAVLMTVGLYIATLGYQAVITTTIIHIAGIATSGMGLFILVAKYKNYDYIFPIMADGVTGDFAQAVLKLTGVYGSIAIILPFLSRVSDKANILKYTVLGTLFVAQNQVVSMIGTIATFSLPWLNAMFYPKLLQTQLVSHFDFMEAGELFVMYQIVGGWLMKYILCFFAAIILVRLLGKPKEYFFWVLSGIIFFAAKYLANNIFMMFDALDYFAYISIVNLIVIPVIIYTIFLFKDSCAIPKRDNSVCRR
ncbi:endospore germination permease [Sporomusa sp.]|uniref:GerAB/ArcD/ProY family transporter n=1 Tax=Sporomusa sp. TaxID=2078658 RepID=UPI002C70F709|nr:endospore germination permease [Sporomusa sp.]HWR44287.1 endospore germination permease [Sporomusa sp.]